MPASAQDCPDGLPMQKHSPQLLNFWIYTKQSVSRSVSTLLLWQHKKLVPYSSPMAVQMGIKVKSKLFLDILCACCIPREEHLSPGAQRLAWSCNTGTGMQHMKRKLHHSNKQLFELVSPPSYWKPRWGGVSKQCLTVSGDCFSDGWRWFPDRVMSIQAFHSDHKKNNIMQEVDKVCSKWLGNATPSINLPFWLNAESKSGDSALMEPLLYI